MPISKSSDDFQSAGAYKRKMRDTDLLKPARNKDLDNFSEKLTELEMMRRSKSEIKQKIYKAELARCSKAFREITDPKNIWPTKNK